MTLVFIYNNQKHHWIISLLVLATVIKLIRSGNWQIIPVPVPVQKTTIFKFEVQSSKFNVLRWSLLPRVLRQFITNHAPLRLVDTVWYSCLRRNNKTRLYDWPNFVVVIDLLHVICPTKINYVVNKVITL